MKQQLAKIQLRLSIVAASLLALGLALSFAESAKADVGLFVEPSLTYELGDTKINYPAPFSDSTGKLQGFGIGARLGMHVSEAIFVGLDGRYSMPKFTDSSVSYDAAATAMNYGPVVGIQMPDIGLRLWGAYVLGGDVNPDASGNLDVKMTGAQGYRLGAGFRIAALSLNLEYQDLRYDSTTLEQIGPFTGGSFDSVKLNQKSWIASVSFPLEL